MRKRLNLGCKKGNIVLDVMLVFVVLIAMAFVSLFGYLVFDDINTDFQNDDDIDADVKADVSSLHTRYPGTMDGIFVFVFSFLWLAVIISAFVIDTHPVFFILGVLLLGFVIFVGAVLSNTYEEIRSETEFLTFADGFPMTNFIIDNLALAIVIVGMTVMLSLYAKQRVGA